MRKLKGTVWAGLACNLAVLFMGSWGFGMRDGWNAGVISITVVLSFAFLLSVAGIILLLRGKAAGGIVGAVGSAFFVPIGLICLQGCLQSRADILREGLMPAATPSAVREQERPAEAQPSAMPDEQAEQNEKSGEQQSQKEAGEQDRATPPGEMPEAAYTFLNETGLAIGMLVFFSLAALGIFSGGEPIWGAVPGIVLGIFKFIQTGARRRKFVYALYRDRLECVISAWSSDLTAIPYGNIREGMIRGSKARLVVAEDGESRQISIPLHLVERSRRDEAVETMERKLKELGVLREDEE